LLSEQNDDPDSSRSDRPNQAAGGNRQERIGFAPEASGFLESGAAGPSARSFGGYSGFCQMTTLEERVQRAVSEDVAVSAYDPRWPELFRREAAHLRSCLPAGLIRRIEHFGSTAVPGLAAKPIIDLLVEVRSLRAARTEIAAVLQAQGYDYFWRPSFGDDVPPWYAFFIRRNRQSVRTHHLHMVTRRRAFQEHWDRLLFRDYLIAHPQTAREYERLKTQLAAAHPNDRVAYTNGKTVFIQRVTAQAKHPQ
jgi:GrpB-like predicted nucleotidyltransferase (UPF0157 family)